MCPGPWERRRIAADHGDDGGRFGLRAMAATLFGKVAHVDTVLSASIPVILKLLPANPTATTNQSSRQSRRFREKSETLARRKFQAKLPKNPVEPRQTKFLSTRRAAGGGLQPADRRPGRGRTPLQGCMAFSRMASSVISTGSPPVAKAMVLPLSLEEKPRPARRTRLRAFDAGGETLAAPEQIDAEQAAVAQSDAAGLIEGGVEDAGAGVGIETNRPGCSRNDGRRPACVAPSPMTTARRAGSSGRRKYWRAMNSTRGLISTTALRQVAVNELGQRTGAQPDGLRGRPSRRSNNHLPRVGEFERPGGNAHGALHPRAEVQVTHTGLADIEECCGGCLRQVVLDAIAPFRRRSRRAPKLPPPEHR